MWQPRSGEMPTYGGYVYAMHSPDTGQIKIGFSRDVAERKLTLQREHGSPLTVVATVSGRIRHERRVHSRLRPYRLTGEWFRAVPAVWTVVGEMNYAEAERLALVEERRRNRQAKRDAHDVPRRGQDNMNGISV